MATAFSLILWGAFFLFKEPAQQPDAGRTAPSRWEISQYGWFAVNSAALTLAGFVFLFGSGTALHLVFPCLSGVLHTNEGGPSSLVLVSLAIGTHLLALATASWIATVRC